MKNPVSERASFSRTAAQSEPRLTKQTVLQVFLKSSIAILLSLAAWELIIRQTIELSPGMTKHPMLGKIYNRGDRIESSEGFSRTRMNSLGLRGNEIPAKAKGEFRVVSIGDSFTSGEQVEDGKTYSDLVESALKQQGDSSLTVVNAGRTGGTPAYYLHLSDFYKTTLQADSIVVQFNDSDFTQEGLDAKKEFYIRPEGSEFKTIHNQDFASDDRLSQLFQQKFPQLGFLLRISLVRVGGRNIQSMLKGGARPETEEEQKKPQNPASTEYDSLIEWTVVSLKAKYPNLIIVHIPYVTFNQPNEPPSSAEASLIKMAEKHSVPIIPMRKDFEDYYRSTHQPASGFNNTIPGIGHINEIGHRLIANRLAPMLKAMQNKAGGD